VADALRIAVIGSGISGLAAAYYLSRAHQVTLFEKAGQLGGHTHTVTVESSTGQIEIDMGFIVHNDRTYPNLVRLFAELGIRTQPSNMSFGVFSRETGFEYSSRGLAGFFAQRGNLLRGEHYRLLREIMRFNREAPRLLSKPDAGELCLGEFLARGRYDAGFLDRYLFPMASAVWSMPVAAMRDFPALTLIRFFDNHGMLGINTHPKWKSVTGGSRTYIAPITRPLGNRVRLNAGIKSVARSPDAVAIHFDDRTSEAFDQVVFACHGDQVLPLLEGPTAEERAVLGRFTTSENEACLHTDETLLPTRADARASWNYLISSEPDSKATLTYHMNRLQSIPTAENYCVTLNAKNSIDPAKILRVVTFHHPVYDAGAIHAQQRWGEISGHNRTHYCGAYWFYGFHEDGLNSALRVARALGVALE
jgi:predicted NAD/FAD-binding protein